MKNIIIIISITFILTFIASSCGYMSNDMMNANSDNFVSIQEQNSGNIKVTLLSKDGLIRKGTGTFRFEFRDKLTGKLINVNNIYASAMMEMDDEIMTGEMNMNNMNMMGVCNMNYNLPMQGSWNCTLNFNNGQKVQFLLNVN
jgi:uncharacterized beta-barrel protein YwiB (DUF1934 family)